MINGKIKVKPPFFFVTETSLTYLKLTLYGSTFRVKTVNDQPIRIRSIKEVQS